MTVTDRLRQFIVHELRWDGPVDVLTDEAPLVQAGIVDSVGIYQMVMLIEDEFGVTVGDDEVVPANFGSIAAIAGFVAARQPQGTAAT